MRDPRKRQQRERFFLGVVSFLALVSLAHLLAVKTCQVIFRNALPFNSLF
jgi:hypothetical protein